MPKENLKIKKSRTKAATLKPGLLMLAAVFLWSAKHEPPDFNIASLGVWTLGALTVALLARAAFALAAPLLGLLGAIFKQTLLALQHEAEP